MCVFVHIPKVPGQGAVGGGAANTTLAFGYPSTIQLLQAGRINFLAPLLEALSVLCP
jgi:hypothetical protein